ncbi:MAG: transposase [Acidobacteriota bacterium]
MLKNTRWLLLKRPENLSAKQEPRLAERLQYNPRSVRAYLLKEGLPVLLELYVPVLGRAVP